MVYGGNPATDTTDAVRLLIYDTSTGPLLTDAEVDWFIAQHANTYFAAAAAAGAIAASYSDDIIEQKVGDLEWKKAGGVDGMSGQYRSLAAELRATGVRIGVAPYAGGISISDKDANLSDSDWDRTHTSAGNPAVW